MQEEKAHAGSSLHESTINSSEQEEGNKATVAESKLPSYLDAEFASEDLRHLIRDREEPPLQYQDIPHKNRSSDILPSWIMTSKDWKNTISKTDGSDVSDILKVPFGQRTLEQNSQLVSFLMTVWKTAAQMGLKRCTQMLAEFKYVSYDPGDYIITEGEEGLTFYIIMSGTCAVDKAGIGVVAHLGKGKAFGELALVKGDVRTASILAETKVEVLSLHKLDYDHFIKDIQAAERRENFNMLRDCSLFAAWPRAKVEKLVNTCQRRTLNIGENVFKQDEEADSLYVIMEGTVRLIKEVKIESKNVWPSSMATWSNRVRKVIKPILTNTLHKSDYFGELAVIRGTPRLETAVAHVKTMLLQITKAEFLHLVHHDSMLSNDLQQQTVINRYPKDEYILNLIGHISGGPRSLAKAGEITIFPNKIHPLKIPPTPSNERPSSIKNRKLKEKAAVARNRKKKHDEAHQDALDSSSTSLAHDSMVGRDDYQEKMNAALNADMLLDRLMSGAIQEGNTVEKLAVKEMNAATELLLQATRHKKILDDPLSCMVTKHSRPVSYSMQKNAAPGRLGGKQRNSLKRSPSEPVSFAPLEMKEQLRYSLGNLSKQPLYATVVKKVPIQPGIRSRKLMGDDVVAKVVVEKRIAKPAEAFI